MEYPSLNFLPAIPRLPHLGREFETLLVSVGIEYVGELLRGARVGNE